MKAGGFSATTRATAKAPFALHREEAGSKPKDPTIKLKTRCPKPRVFPLSI